MSMIAMMGMGSYELMMFGTFVAMLVGLLLLHHHKNLVVYLGFAALSIQFIMEMGSFGDWTAHYLDSHHRKDLLLNLTLLIPAFALVAHYFEHSGASNALARVLKADSSMLWTVFWLSTILDNIAAALIGATILLAKYGKDAPFRMIVGCIGASNLGGAGSPVGDTTTVMLFISKIPASELMMGFIATIPAMFVLNLWAVKHGVQPKVQAQTASGESAVHWSHMWPILAIPGLVVGNIVAFNYGHILGAPGMGVWVGCIVGLVIARLSFNWKVFKEAIPNMIFLVTLVAAAEMLPLESIKPSLESMPSIAGFTSRDMVALMMGHLSAWFDNIPLTAICIQLQGFDWALLAYCVGYGGSAMWFGSSAGVAMGLIFPQTYDTKRWGMPFIIITLTYWVGAVAYHLIEPSIAMMLLGHTTGQH